jgi:hypothetical protein
MKQFTLKVSLFTAVLLRVFTLIERISYEKILSVFYASDSCPYYFLARSIELEALTL